MHENLYVLLPLFKDHDSGLIYFFKSTFFSQLGASVGLWVGVYVGILGDFVGHDVGGGFVGHDVGGDGDVVGYPVGNFVGAGVGALDVGDLEGNEVGHGNGIFTE